MNLAKHRGNLWYILRHKWFVFQAGARFSVPMHQRLFHDWHKFLPGEFRAYTEWFYSDEWGEDQIRAWERMGRFYDHGKRLRNFNRAWLQHLHRAPHHWQHWLLIDDDGQMQPLRMPDRFAREMVADWVGAGRALGHGDDLLRWYSENRQLQTLHPDTRALVDLLTGWTKEAA